MLPQYYWKVAILLKWSVLWGGGTYSSRLSDNWPVLLRAVEMRRGAPPLSIIIFCSWLRSNNDGLPYYLSHALASPLAAHVQLLKHGRDNRISQTPPWKFYKPRPRLASCERANSFSVHAIYAIINKYSTAWIDRRMAAGGGHSSSIFLPRES